MHILKTLKYVLCLSQLFLLLACSNQKPIDLAHIYAMSAPNQDQPPIILIHGALGSSLQTTDGRAVWPGSINKILFSNYPELALPIDSKRLLPEPSHLLVSGITEQAAGRDFYGRIIRTLEDVGSFKRATPGKPIVHGLRRYYVFSYDWRQDNVATAKKLHEYIEQIRTDYGKPDLKVDIVAHSMGGLVTRYYARYGNQDVLDSNDLQPNLLGEKSIRRVVLLGTPSLGSVGALRTLIRGYQVGLGLIPPEVVVTFPSTFQLLPHAITEWFVDINGKPLLRDQFDADNFWRRFQFSVFAPSLRDRLLKQAENEGVVDDQVALLQAYFHKHIERARRFSWSLSVPVPQSEIRYIVFGGDCLPTPSRVVVEEVDGVSHLRLFPHEIAAPVPGIDYERLMFAPGDGTVSKASLLARRSADPGVARHAYSNFALDYPIFLCERHDQLTGNIDFQNNLLHALLSVDR